MGYLTIVMYHYVRPIRNSMFPGIKGLELDGFVRQLDYLQEHFCIISTAEVINAVEKRTRLPNNACWLTFDDGYKDHYNYVLPELKRRKLSAAFFPPQLVASENQILDVNAVHYILSRCENINVMVSELNRLAISLGVNKEKIYDLETRFKKHSRFDNAQTIYFKRLLQHALPLEVRKEIINILFSQYVGSDKSQISENLYMSKFEICELLKNGMFVGSHGTNHVWLDRLDEFEQQEEIYNSLQFLEEVGAERKNWIICYPYGGYNETTLSVARKYGACLGVTTEARAANIFNDIPLALPRFDTNDFPQ